MTLILIWKPEYYAAMPNRIRCVGGFNAKFLICEGQCAYLTFSHIDFTTHSAATTQCISKSFTTFCTLFFALIFRQQIVMRYFQSYQEFPFCIFFCVLDFFTPRSLQSKHRHRWIIGNSRLLNGLLIMKISLFLLLYCKIPIIHAIFFINAMSLWAHAVLNLFPESKI